MLDQNEPNDSPFGDQGFDNLIKDINGDVDYFDSDPSGKYQEPPQFPVFNLSFLQSVSSQANPQEISHAVPGFQTIPDYSSRPMTTIRVDPSILQNCAQDIQSSSATLRAVSGNIDSCANSAPSYDGQFNSRVRVIASDAIMRGNQLSGTFNGLFGWLDNKARQFLDADFASSNVFSMQFNNLPWMSILKMVFPPLSILPFLSVINNLFRNELHLWVQVPGNQNAKSPSPTIQSGVASIIDRNYVNQIDAMLPLGITSNADCGPASLIMALLALGIRVPGGSLGNQISTARKDMAANTAEDGLSGGKPDASEHGIPMNVDDIVRGAETNGSNAETLNDPSIINMIEELKKGHTLVVSGTHRDMSLWKLKYPPKNYPSKHVIAVLGYDPVQKKFLVADPLSSGSQWVAEENLASFMSENGSATVISNRKQ